MSIDPSELARQLAARRKPKPVTCPVCGTQAVGVGRRKYCSKQCAKLAWWRRHHSKAAQLTREAAALGFDPITSTCPGSPSPDAPSSRPVPASDAARLARSVRFPPDAGAARRP